MTSRRRQTAECWARAHRPVEQEITDAQLSLVRGTLPSALRGVLYRCGPGRLEAYSTQYQHLFDGDGHVCRFAFDGSAVHLTNRYVRTREFLEELAAQRVLYRSFGTPKPGGLRANAFDARFKNAANTTAFVFRHKLWALWEAGLPHALDPVTLETIGRDDFAQRLLAVDRVWTRIAGRELPFSAHPRVDPHTNELFNFGLANGPTQKLLLYRVDPALRMAVPEEHKLDALYFVHDFSLTSRFRVLFLCPARFGIVRTMLGLDTPRSGMRFDPSRPTKVWLCPRDGSAPLVLEAPPGFVFHHVNAWEEDRNTLIVHALRSDVLPDLPVPRDIEAHSVAPPKRELPLYCEYAIDLARRRVRVAPLFDVPCELPMVHRSQFSTRHRFAWATATDPSKPMRVHTRLAKFDLDEHTVTTIDFAPGFAGEPVFVPRPNAVRGDDGWLLTMGYDGEEQRSVLRIVDAQTLEIVCVFALPFDIAPGFHGTWMSAP